MKGLLANALLAWALAARLVAAPPTTIPTAEPITVTDVSLRAKASSVASAVSRLRTVTLTYAVQHHGRFPSLDELKSWNLFLKLTNAKGEVVRGADSDRPFFGPYIAKIPTNALTGKSEVCDAAALVPTAGWAVQTREGRPLWLAVVPDAGIPLIQELVRNHVAVACPGTCMPKVKGTPLPAPADLQAHGVAALTLMRIAELNSAIRAYGLDHDYGAPSRKEIADWKVLLAGRAPYLQEVPENPYGGDVRQPAISGHADGTAAWAYDENLGTFHAVVPTTMTVLSPLHEEDVERMEEGGK